MARRLTTNQEIAGSTPASVIFLWFLGCVDQIFAYKICRSPKYPLAELVFSDYLDYLHLPSVFLSSCSIF